MSNPPNRELSQREPGKNAIGLISKTTTLHTYMTLFCTFLYRHCGTTTWKRLISRLKENLNKRRRWFSFFFLNLSEVPKKSTPGKFTYIWHFQRIGINATKCGNTGFILKETVSLPSPSSMLKLPNREWTATTAKTSLTWSELARFFVDYFHSLSWSNIGKFSWNYILKSCVQVHDETEKFVVNVAFS